MKHFLRLAFAAGVLALVVTGVRPAAADFTLCSQYRQTITAAYAYYDGSDWTSIGWYSVNPSQCTTLYTGSLQSRRYFYLYAYADDGSVWDGEYFFCTHWPNAFQIWGDDDCDVGFLEIDTENFADWTHTLTP